MIILMIKNISDIYINVDENMMSHLKTFTYYVLHNINININKNIMSF